MPELFQDILEQYNGFEFTVALDGSTALLQAFLHRFDVIVMDLRLPDANGLEVIRRIRAGRGPNRDTPILAISAYTDRHSRQEVRAAGANDYVAKPPNFFDLYRRVVQLAVEHMEAAPEDHFDEAEIKAMCDRLNTLKLQKARYGLAVPAHIAMEIVDLEREIEERQNRRRSSAGRTVSDSDEAT